MNSAGPRERRYLGLSAAGFHDLAYGEWGAADSERVVVCVHGLTRNGRDFDVLAAALAEKGCRVVCPDVVGRGASGRLADPAGYGYPQYLADMNALLARLDVEQVDWVGTSMGGLIGMMLAAQPGAPIRRLVINDVGPFIPLAALERIGGYVGRAPVFADLDAAEAYLRDVYATMGALGDLQWRHLTLSSVEAVKGGYRLAYDPAIAEAFKQVTADIDLWSLWDAITAPTLVLRGANSDLLLAETAAEMAARGPKAKVIEIPGCGHTPSLMDVEQIALVRDWVML